MKRILTFIAVIYWKAIAIICLIVSRKFLVVVGNDLYAIRCGLTIGDAKRLAKYLDDLADKRIDENRQDQAISEVRKIIERK